MTTFPECPGEECDAKLTITVPGGARGNALSGPVLLDAYPFPDLAECAAGHRWHRWIGEREWRPGVG